MFIRNIIIIDEIQYLKNPTNFLKFIYDEYKGKVKLIVSGSSAFYIDKKFTINHRHFFYLKTNSNVLYKQDHFFSFHK